MSRRLGRSSEVPSTFHSLDRRHRDVAGDRLGERLGNVLRLSQFGIGDRALRRLVHNGAVTDPKRCAIDLPALRRQIEEQLAGGSRPAADRGTVLGVLPLPAVMPSSGARAVSAMISRMRAGSNRSSSAAAWVSSAREPCPASTLPVMTVIEPSRSMCSLCGDVAGSSPAEPSRPPPRGRHAHRGLGQGNLAADGNQQPSTEHFDKSRRERPQASRADRPAHRFPDRPDGRRNDRLS